MRRTARVAMTNQTWMNVRDLDLDDLAEGGSVDQNPLAMQAVVVAFQRLQTRAIQEAAAAQISAASDQKEAVSAAGRVAKAAEETAKYTRESARWMKWTVMVIAAS